MVILMSFRIVEKGKMKLATPSKKAIESIKAAANNTLKKTSV
jgi:hypothetical protein